MHLHIGRRCTGITLAPVRQYPGMWRVIWPDGKVSPMGNISRAKEAAIRYARQLPEFSGSTLAHRWDRLAATSEAPRTAVLPELVG